MVNRDNHKTVMMLLQWHLESEGNVLNVCVLLCMIVFLTSVVCLPLYDIFLMATTSLE